VEGFVAPKEFAEYAGAFKSKSVEDWASYRENTLKYFKMDKKAIVLGLIFGVAVPYGVYKLSRGELMTKDKRRGQEKTRL